MLTFGAIKRNDQSSGSENFRSTLADFLWIKRSQTSQSNAGTSPSQQASLPRRRQSEKQKVGDGLKFKLKHNISIILNTFYITNIDVFSSGDIPVRLTICCPLGQSNGFGENFNISQENTDCCTIRLLYQRGKNLTNVFYVLYSVQVLQVTYKYFH